MMKSLLNHPFLSMLDYTPEEFDYYLDLAEKLKQDKAAGKEIKTLNGKNFALIFEKDSTRTRCAFEVAAHDQGAYTTYLGPTGTQIGKKESIADTARVLGSMFDAIEFRGYEQSAVEELAAKAGVPVWNGLTDYDHPTQTLANSLTLKEHFKKPLNQLSYAYVGHGQSNMAHALMAGAALAGMDFRIIGPARYFPEDDFTAKCKKIAEKTGASFTFTDDPVEGVKGLDVIYTGVWVTMGDPYDLWGERIKLFMPYRITMDMIKNTGNPDTVFCHCLPSFHNTETKVGKDIYERFGLNGIEVTDDVFEAPFSLAFQEAANRLPTIKAVMIATFGEYPMD
ncbi:ornithine carbamoyltransferase [Dialister sp. UBA1703]|uniref:ornithine carbamoyltransferase n=1 Tax=Dialister sp. UBA1703 TaxID=1946415 RepID=UPI0025B915DD|nr:ornithine carbamoyltransferase [Dialister sp. UBA1703]